VEVELLEIRDFVASHHPFDTLTEDVINDIIPSLTIRYLRRGREFPPKDESEKVLYLIRRGAISLVDVKGRLLSKLGESDFYSPFCALHDDKIDSGEATEDTLMYLIPCEIIESLSKKHPDFARFFKPETADRLKQALSRISQNPGGSSLTTLKIIDLIKREPICLDSGKSVQEAAQRMTQERVSSLLITTNEKLTGILTDRDIRSRIVATNKPYDTLIAEVMTTGIHSIESQVSAFDALMMMTQESIHHLPVIDNDELLGMLSVTDLIRQESSNAVYLAGMVRKAKTLDNLIEVSMKLPELQLYLVNAGGTSQHIGHAVTTVTDAFTKRLLAMAEEKLGPPPVPYAWICAGSQARFEQSAHSDQDNGLIIDDSMQPGDDEYFREMAMFVNTALDKCGYVVCPGDVMASNTKWRQPKKVWENYFHSWIWSPEPMALMLSSIFFDMRVVHGDESLFYGIKDKILEDSKKNKIFLAFMASNALKHRPPLGFFRDFVLINDGEHNNTLDLKHNGIVPIIDLARLCALAQGIEPVNTLARLKQCGGTPSMSAGASADLTDAYEFIGTLRVQHQAEQIRLGQKPDNYVSPQSLSKLEREHLKEAFRVISRMQETIGSRYQTSRLV